MRGPATYSRTGVQLHAQLARLVVFGGQFQIDAAHLPAGSLVFDAQVRMLGVTSAPTAAGAERFAKTHRLASSAALQSHSARRRSHAVQFNEVYPHGLTPGHVRASSPVRIKPSSLAGLVVSGDHKMLPSVVIEGIARRTHVLGTRRDAVLC